jgi:serine/threonine protein kinase
MAASIIHQVLKGLNYVHGQDIMHRDLKPENIMCFEEADGKISAKLTDFGFACVLKAEGAETLSCGSPVYMAPEVISSKPYDKRADVWSLGVIVYFILSGQFPFWGGSFEELEENITSQQVSFTHKAFTKVSEDAKSFIKACLTRPQRDRPFISDLL